MPDVYHDVHVTIPALGIKKRHCATVIRGANSTYRTFVYWHTYAKHGVSEPDVDVPDDGVFIVNDRGPNV